MASDIRHEAKLALDIACSRGLPVALLINGQFLSFSNVWNVDINETTLIAHVRGRLVDPQKLLPSNAAQWVQLNLNAVSAVIGPDPHNTAGPVP